MTLTRILEGYLIIGMVLTAYDLAFRDCRETVKGVGSAIAITLVMILFWPYVVYRTITD